MKEFTTNTHIIRILDSEWVGHLEGTSIFGIFLTPNLVAKYVGIDKMTLQQILES